MARPKNGRSSAVPFRNALEDHVQVHSEIVAQGQDDRVPLVSIAIPTYRRPEFLREAVESALSQQFDGAVEILVVDNQPKSGGPQILLQELSELRRANFRYIVNRENIGMFGNWNRCIQYARGEWLTILNDDDLLDSDFLASMFEVLRRQRQVDGIICRKRTFYQGKKTPSSPASFVRELGKRILLELLFAGRTTRRIMPHKFFWGSQFGNGAGFIFRRSKALEIGGFYEEEFPSADYWFALRFSKIAHYRQHRKVAASIRVAENETANPRSIRLSMKTVHDLQQAMAGDDVPRWWKRLSPMIAARDRADYKRLWDVEIPATEVEQMLAMKLPRHRPILLWAMRILLRGF